MTDPFDWPKTMRVGGREYELSPEMSAMAMNEAMESFQNEAEKIAALQYAIHGRDTPDEVMELIDMDADDLTDGR